MKTPEGYDPILTHDQLALTAVSEEMGEVAIEISKGRRFGWSALNPVDQTTPAYRLAVELGDLLGSIDLLLDTHPQIDPAVVNKSRSTRIDRLIYTNDRNTWRK